MPISHLANFMSRGSFPWGAQCERVAVSGQGVRGGGIIRSFTGRGRAPIRGLFMIRSALPRLVAAGLMAAAAAVAQAQTATKPKAAAPAPAPAAAKPAGDGKTLSLGGG